MAELKFSSLKHNDEQMNVIINNFSERLKLLENDLDFALNARDIPSVTTEGQIKRDTYLAYAASSLYWMFLRLRGSDMSKHHILHDLARAKELLDREKEINDSQSAPRLDMPASNRFISAGLHTRFVDMDGVMVTEAQYKCRVQDGGTN